MNRRMIYLRGNLGSTLSVQVWDAETEKRREDVKKMDLHWNASEAKILGTITLVDRAGAAVVDVEVVPGPQKECPACKGKGSYTGLNTIETCQVCNGTGELPV